MRSSRFYRMSVFCGFFCLLLCLPGASYSRGQDGFTKVSGKHLDLITDLPESKEVEELIEVFDAAIPIWCEKFHVTESEASRWRATGYLMVARERFSAAGYLPDSLPPFPHGYQWNDRLWVVEQSSQYYRRHLLLHEGTHWFMFRKYGNAGPPWLMEGIADWLATHRWDGRELQMGILPATREEVPYWGRIGLIRGQLAEGTAPSLEAILRYDNTAHQRVDAYAWSWAAVQFLRNHPAAKAEFEELLEGPIRADESTTRKLLRGLQTRRPLMRAEWTVMLTELDYGYDPNRELMQLNHRLTPLGEAKSITVAADRGWQPTGIEVAEGKRVIVKASGRYTIGVKPKPWMCEPEGVTLRYHQGAPLGKLMMAVAPKPAKEPQFSETLRPTAVGASAEWTADASGEILFRVNEAASGLADNSGELTVTVQSE